MCVSEKVKLKEAVHQSIEVVQQVMLLMLGYRLDPAPVKQISYTIHTLDWRPAS
jgi:hypothetical protein